MKMATLSGIVLTAMLGIPFSAAAGQAATPATPLAPGTHAVDGDALVSAFAADLRQQRDVRLAMAPIRSRTQLDQYLARTPAADSPFSKLSPGARKRFLAGVTFNERGITGFRYGDLEMELSATDAYRILSLFGVEDLVPMLAHLRTDTPADQLIMAKAGTRVTPTLRADYMNYWCASRATCLPQEEAICTTNC